MRVAWKVTEEDQIGKIVGRNSGASLGNSGRDEQEKVRRFGGKNSSVEATIRK